MEAEFLTNKLAKKFSKLTKVEVPAQIPPRDEIDDYCARLFFDGIKIDSSSLKHSYKFRLRYYAPDWKESNTGIDDAENYIRSGKPEIFTDGENKFYVRYFDIDTIYHHMYTASGVMHCYTEVAFSVIF